MDVAPVPPESVALWKRFVNPAPVDAFVFEITAENVFAVPAVANVGETKPAVRSGFVTGSSPPPPLPVVE